MTPTDQLAFDIQAFLFQNILDAQIQQNGLLRQQDKVFSFFSIVRNTTFPVVINPAPIYYPGKCFDLNLFRPCAHTIANEQMFPCYFALAIVDVLFKLLNNRFISLFYQAIHATKEITHADQETFVRRCVFPVLSYSLDKNELSIAQFDKGQWPDTGKYHMDDLNRFLKDSFSPNKALPYIGFENTKNETKLSCHMRDYASGPADAICLLLNMVHCIVQFAQQYKLGDVFPANQSILDINVQGIQTLLKTYPQLSDAREVINHNVFYFTTSKEIPIELPSQPVVAPFPISNYPVHPVSALPSNLAVNSQVPEIPVKITQELKEQPSISTFHVLYEKFYKFINEQKNITERDLLFLFRVEAELLKRLKDKELIHPFNLDKPLFKLTPIASQNDSNNPDDILRPIHFYTSSFMEWKALEPNDWPSEQKRTNIPAYSKQETYRRFTDMQKWGALSLLHFITYQQTNETEHTLDEIIRVAYEVAERLDLPTDDETLYCKSPLKDRGDYSEAMEIAPQETNTFEVKPFKGNEGQTYYHVLKLPSLDFYIPEVFASVSYFDLPVPLLLPPKHHHLFNSQLVKDDNKTLYINSKLSEVISRELKYLTCANELIKEPQEQLSWWGGEKTLDYVDMEILKGRTVICVCHGHEDFELSLKVCARLQDAGATPGIVYNKKEYTKDNFLLLAEMLVYNGDMHGFMEFKTKDEDTNVSSNPMDIIKGYFSTGQFIVLVGEAKVGKTYVGLSLALSVASGKSMHELWKCNNDFKGNVFYCHGEMNADTIYKRITALANHMGLQIIDIEEKPKEAKQIRLYRVIEDSDEANRICNQKEACNQEKGRLLATLDLAALVNGSFDVTNEEHQQQLKKEVEHVQKSANNTLIIFDNYVNVVGGSASVGEAKFNKAFSYFSTLMRDGACVMLIHHTNSEQEIAATKQIERKAYGVIRLTRNNVLEETIRKEAAHVTSDRQTRSISSEELESYLTNFFYPDNPNVYVTYLYYREKAAKNLKPFHMFLDMENGTSWECEEINPKEIIKKIVSEYSKGNATASKDAYEELIKMTPEDAMRDISRRALDACNGIREKAKKMTPTQIAKLYGKEGNTVSTFTKHVGANILGKDKSKNAKEEELQKIIENNFPDE